MSVTLAGKKWLRWGLRQASRTRSISHLGLGSEYTCMFTLEKLMGPLDLCTLLHTRHTSTKNLQRQLHRDWHISVFVSNSKVGQCTPLVRLWRKVFSRHCWWGCYMSRPHGVEFDAVTAWVASAQNSYVEALVSSTTELDCFRNRTFKWAIKLKWGH